MPPVSRHLSLVFIAGAVEVVNDMLPVCMFACFGYINGYISKHYGEQYLYSSEKNVAFLACGPVVVLEFNMLSVAVI